MLKARANSTLINNQHVLSETLLETIDNYEIERSNDKICEVTLNEASEGDKTDMTMIPRPMKIKERPKSVSMHNNARKPNSHKTSMEKIVWAQSLGKFDNTATKAVIQQKLDRRYKGYSFGQSRE